MSLMRDDAQEKAKFRWTKEQGPVCDTHESSHNAPQHPAPGRFVVPWCEPNSPPGPASAPGWKEMTT